MRYVTAKYKMYTQELTYRFYIADSLYWQADNKRLTKKLSDFYENKPKDNRTGDEIAEDVIKRLNLKVN